MVLIVLMGDSVNDPLSWNFIVPLAVKVLISVGSFWLYRRYQRRWSTFISESVFVQFLNGGERPGLWLCTISTAFHLEAFLDCQNFLCICLMWMDRLCDIRSVRRSHLEKHKYVYAYIREFCRPQTSSKCLIDTLWTIDLKLSNLYDISVVLHVLIMWFKVSLDFELYSVIVHVHLP